MRLTSEEKIIIRSTINEFEPEARIRLFGSRTDNNARGGDIDLLIISSYLTYRDKLSIRSTLKEKLGDRKIDIIITKKPDTAFTRYAYEHSLAI